MRFLKCVYRKLVKDSSSSKVTTLYPSTSKICGHVLLSYLDKPLTWKNDDIKFSGHSNKWESAEISRIFLRLGFIVDAIHFMDSNFLPTKNYDIIFDIYVNLQRLAPFIDKKTIKILHLTGSYPYYQNHAEIKRVEYLENKRGVIYTPKRLVAFPELYERSIRLADSCSLIGNSHTLETYPEKHRHKITLTTVSGSIISCVKSKYDFIPINKEFLWFFGGGVVHKGLDLVLDVFAKNKKLILNVVGDVESEKDFIKIYEYELTKLDNIKYHGYLDPNSKAFEDVTKNVFCFIAPSCSESISSAVATCMQIGLYPIITRDTGISLPEGCGIYLNNLCIEEIENAIIKVHTMSANDLRSQIKVCQEYALKQFSREKFSNDMTKVILKALDNRCDI